MKTLLLAALLALLGGAHGQAVVDDINSLPVIEFEAGKRLEELPGYMELLYTKDIVPKVEVALTAARIKARERCRGGGERAAIGGGGGQ